VRSHTLTKKSVGLRKSAPASPLAKPKPFRRNIGGETSRQCVPPSVVMSSGVGLSSLAHPTLGLRKYIAPTSCACAAVVKVRGVDEATLGWRRAATSWPLSRLGRACAPSVSIPPAPGHQYVAERQVEGRLDASLVSVLSTCG